MDRSVHEALDCGRSVIVPTPQVGARMRLAFARSQLAAGNTAWTTPDILTWEAWLSREWQRGLDPAHPAARLRVLNRAQERRLWSEVLRELAPMFPEGSSLNMHASALRRAAHRVRQWQMAAPVTPLTSEESLLWLALTRVEQQAERQSSIILGLAGVETLAALKAPAPLFAGVTQLTPLQRKLADALWAGQGLIAHADVIAMAAPRQWRASDAAEEIRAAALWCRDHLTTDPSRRLLVVQAGGDQPLPQLAASLWRHLSEGSISALSLQRDARWLNVEGGEPLLQHALIEQAITLLGGLQGPLEMTDLGRLLLSPYFEWADEGVAVLETRLREHGRTHWNMHDLLAALDHMSPGDAAAARCAQHLRAALAQLGGEGVRQPGDWAARFDRALAAAGFPGRRTLDTRDAQRHMRWRELLDEFASLDALGPWLTAQTAWEELQQLARHGAHEAAGGDAAIIVTADRSDPLVRFDGIWVLGLAEEALPAPPRPDAFVALSAQRAAGWPESSVELRRQQALQELSGWQRRGTDLVFSHAAQEGDLHRRGTRLLPPEAWQQVQVLPAAPHDESRSLWEETVDARLPAVAIATGDLLRGASSRLRLQQDCAFRSQAQTRLGAVALETPAEGIDPRLRGELLHAALDGIWEELHGSNTLRSLDDEARHDLLHRHWRVAEAKVLAERAAPPDARVLARERRRGIALLGQLLVLEAGRGSFEVDSREQRVEAPIGPVRMWLRIDRIDRLADGRRLLIDYKSGQVDRPQMEEDPPRPLQLALYASALSAVQQPVQALALLSLAPGKLRLRGVAQGAADDTPGLEALEDWQRSEALWQHEVLRLLEEHLAGAATVTPATGVCRLCHLPALCRIGEQRPMADSDDEESADE